MKCTNFYKMTQKIKSQENKELVEALKAHGNDYTWKGEAEKPVVAANPNTIIPNPIDIVVNRVIAKDDGSFVRILGEDKEFGNPVEIASMDVFTGHLMTIIESLPETDKVQDVSIKTTDFNILSVCRDDLKDIGYSVAYVQDHEMAKIASKLGDNYCDNLFWDSLESIADSMKIPKISNLWWRDLTLSQLEEITEFKRTKYSSENNYQEFRDMCDIWWKEKGNYAKRKIYNIYNK